MFFELEFAVDHYNDCHLGTRALHLVAVVCWN